MNLETYHFDCECQSPEHTLRFAVDPDSQDPELYTEVYLNDHRGFFKRLWYGLRYIFGYQCRYGAWDCWVMREEDIGRLRNLLDRYEVLVKAKPEKTKPYPQAPECKTFVGLR